MGFDRYRCVLDRIFSFSKLPEYRRRFCFRKYRTAFVSNKKNVKVKVVESFTDRFRLFSSLLPSSLIGASLSGILGIEGYNSRNTGQR